MVDCTSNVTVLDLELVMIEVRGLITRVREMAHSEILEAIDITLMIEISSGPLRLGGEDCGLENVELIELDQYSDLLLHL